MPLCPPPKPPLIRRSRVPSVYLTINTKCRDGRNMTTKWLDQDEQDHWDTKEFLPPIELEIILIHTNSRLSGRKYGKKDNKMTIAKPNDLLFKCPSQLGTYIYSLSVKTIVSEFLSKVEPVEIITLHCVRLGYHISYSPHSKSYIYKFFWKRGWRYQGCKPFVFYHEWPVYLV